MNLKIEGGKQARVLVIGASGLDVIGRIETALVPATSNPARIRTSHGGAARNVAENLACLGQPVSLITAVGNDRAGRDLLAQAKAAGVNVAGCVRSEDLPTGFYMGLLNPQGGLDFAVDDMRVTSLITPDHLRARHAQLDRAAMICLDANLPDETLQYVVEAAWERKIPVCADPTSTHLALKLVPYLPRIRLLVPNAGEAGVLTGQAFKASNESAAKAAARHLVGLGVGIVLITLAEFGVVYATAETSGYIPAIHTHISDPTGAGDALTAALIFGLLNDVPLDDAIRLGVSAATLTLRTPGAVAPDLSLEVLYDQLLP
jgi:pseudouridine kinase